MRFDIETGALQFIESMRYKDANSETKTLWINQALKWDVINGNQLPTIGAVTWFDEGTPWAVFSVEDIVYNEDVQEHIQVNGP